LSGGKAPRPLTRQVCALTLRLSKYISRPSSNINSRKLAIHRGRDADALAQEAISRYPAEEAPDLLKPSSWARRR